MISSFLFQIDKNDENNNLRMNEINFKQVILFNLIVLNESCFCWIEFFNWWISLFHLIHSFQIEKFNWIIKEMNLNNQFDWYLLFFLLRRKSSCKWSININEMIIDSSLSFIFQFGWIIWIECLYQVADSHFNPNTEGKDTWILFQQLTFRIDESSIQMLDEIQWMI